MSVLKTDVAVRLRVFNHDKSDSVLLPVSAFNMSFAVNEFPICSLRLPLGSYINPNNRRATLDRTTRDRFLRRYHRCQLIAVMQGDFTAETAWKTQATVIFDGRIEANSDSVTRDQASYQLTLVHWLSYLESGSLLMSYAASSDPTDTKVLAANYGVAGTDADEVVVPGEGPRAKPMGLGQLADVLFLEQNAASEDLWANGMKALWSKLLVNPLKSVTEDLDCISNVNRPSADLIDSMQRIEGPSADLGSPYSKWAVPLTISTADDPLPLPVQSSIFRSLLSSPVEAFQRATAWERLIADLHTKLDCVIIPRIESAIVAPYLPDGLYTHCHRISRNDVISVSAVQPVRRPLRAVGVKVNLASLTGAVGAMRMNEIANKGLACYAYEDAVQGQPESDREHPSSRTLFVGPPAYLSHLNRAEAAAFYGSQRGKVTGTTASPPKPPPPPDPEVQQRRERYREMLIAHAKSVYHRNHRLGNSLTVVSKLRYDISPGSQLIVSLRADQFGGERNSLELVQGYVTRVSVGFDAVTRSGATILQLQHVRPKNDHEDRASLERHPLYQHVFTGATLTDRYENVTCPQPPPMET